MFDELVESTKHKQEKRARRLFFVTGVIYVVALTALGVMAVIGFNPALAEGYDVKTCLVPPLPSGPDPKPAPMQPNPNPAPNHGFVPPKEDQPISTQDQWKDLNLGSLSAKER